MRYAYVKNGDAVDQVRRVTSATTIDRSGPDAFIGDFIRAHAQDELLILCRMSHRDKLTLGKIHAESFPLSGSGPIRLLRRFWSALQIFFAIYRWRPDRVLCGSTTELLWAAAAAAKLRGVPLVHSRHNEMQRKSGLGAIAPAIDRLCIRSCAGVVCHGPFLADQIRALGFPSERTHEFEVDLSDFARAAKGEMAPPLRDFAARFNTVVSFVGRVQHDKGVLDLLDAFEALPASIRATTGLVYVGDGKDMPLLRQRIAASPAGDQVLLAGKCPHADLPAWMRGADVIVAPTRPEFPEGRCMVVLESLALGIPVIAPRSGPFPYAIKHDVNGLLFEPGSVTGLTEVLTRFTSDENVRERLRSGAVRAGEEIISTRTSFATAVEMAFGAQPRPSVQMS